MGRLSPLGLAAVASLTIHGGLGAALYVLPGPAQVPPAAQPDQRPRDSSGKPDPGAPPEQATGIPEVLPGARASAGADARSREGAGQRLGSPLPFVLMFSSPATVQLQDSAMNNLVANQTQRIRTAPDRATQEQRRATPNPAEEVFLASGSGGHRERRAPSRTDAADGAPRGALPHPDGSRTAAEVTASGKRLRIDPQPLGSEAVTPRGVLGGRGTRHSRRARVKHARPDLDEGPAATTSEVLDARIRDNRDAELLAAQLQRSLVEASVRGRPSNRAGQGGDRAGRGSGSAAGRATGGRARPYTPGAGRDGALDTRDSRYIRWFTEQRARVSDAVVFPTRRALLKDQGTSLYRVVVRRDGRLDSAPRLLRSSGYADMDAAAISAIRRAAPFSPLPDRLAPDLQQIAIVIPVEFANPMVQ